MIASPLTRKPAAQPAAPKPPQPGFTGEITDSIGRKRKYVNGEPVAIDQPEWVNGEQVARDDLDKPAASQPGKAQPEPQQQGQQPAPHVADGAQKLAAKLGTDAAAKLEQAAKDYAAKGDHEKAAAASAMAKHPVSKRTTTAAADAKGEQAVRKKAEHTPQEAQALSDYRKTKFVWEANNWLRGKGLTGMLGLAGGEFKAKVAHLDNAIAKSETAEAIEVYRGMKLPKDKIAGMLKVGAEIQDHAFVSTTLAPEVAESFASNLNADNASVVWKVKVPKGSQAHKMPRGEGEFDEAEVLMPRGSKMKITNVTKAKAANGLERYEVEAEYSGFSHSRKLTAKSLDRQSGPPEGWSRFVWEEGDVEILDRKVKSIPSPFRKSFDESKVKRDHGKFAEKEGAKGEEKKPAPKKKPRPKDTRVRSERWKNQPGTIFQAVRDFGGINAQKMGGRFNVKSEFFEAGLGLLLTSNKNAQGIDTLAEEMANAGHFVVPDGSHAEDYLLELLQKGAHSLHANLEKQIEAEQAAYYKELEDAKQHATESEIAEVVRRGEEAGEVEGKAGSRQGDAGQLADAKDDDEGLDFNFGANEKPRRNIPSPLTSHYRKKGAAAKNIQAAAEHLAKHKDVHKAVEHIMEFGGLTQASARRYVRMAVKNAAEKLDKKIAAAKKEKSFDESKVHRDHGKFAETDGAKDVSVGMKPDTQFLSAKSDVGLIGGHVRDGVLHISTAEIAEASRGKGEGVRLYAALIDHALANGLKVFSDSTVEAPAVRVYESLKRRGYDVRRLPGGQLEDGSVYGKGATEPAFEVVSGPSQS